MKSIFPRQDAVQYTDEDRILLIVFFVLQITGFVTLSCVILTVLVAPSTAKRHICWINCQLAWIISALSYCLLLGRPLDWAPPHGLCFTQAVLVYSVPTLAASTTAALMVHVFFCIRSIVSTSGSPSSHLLAIVLAIGPYVAASCMVAVTLVFGFTDPSLVERRVNDGGLYCGIGNGIPGRVSAIVVTAIMVFCLILEFNVLFKLRRNWSNLKKRRRNHPMLSLSIRVMTFSIFGCVGIGLSLVFVFHPTRGAVPNLVLATLPFIAAVIFGTQQDILDVWLGIFCCRRPIRRQLSISQPSTSASNAAADWEANTSQGYSLKPLDSRTSVANVAVEWETSEPHRYSLQSPNKKSGLAFPMQSVKFTAASQDL